MPPRPASGASEGNGPGPGGMRSFESDYKKGTESILREWNKRSMVSKSVMDASLSKAEEALSRAEGRDRDKEKEKEKDKEEKVGDKDGEDKREFDGNMEWSWQPSFREKLGQVHKVINANFALGVSYHNVGWQEKRFFILFDTCDVWINGEILQRSGKTMKDVIKDGDHIKFNAVHVDTSNSWNLFYLATAVIVNKSERGVREEQMPGRAVAKESSSEVASAKVTTFKTVADKMTKKPVPVDPNQAEREEIMRKRKEEIEKRRALAKKNNSVASPSPGQPNMGPPPGMYNKGRRTVGFLHFSSQFESCYFAVRKRYIFHPSVGLSDSSTFHHNLKVVILLPENVTSFTIGI